MKKELLTSVYNKMRSRLIARAKSVVISDDEARDVIQEAFCNLWARPTRLEHEAQAEALFMTAVRNLSIDVIRRDNAKRTSSLEENTDMPDTGDTDAENRMETYRQVERIAGKHLSRHSLPARQGRMELRGYSRSIWHNSCQCESDSGKSQKNDKKHLP